MKLEHSEALLAAVRRCLPFIEQVNSMASLFPNGSGSAECVQAVKELREVLARIEAYR